MSETMDLVFDSPFRMEMNPDKAFVFDIYDHEGKKLSKQEIRALIGDQKPDMMVAQGSSVSEIKVCAEGDSWIDILWPLSSALGHERTFFDVIKLSGNYDALEFGHPADTFEDMLDEKEYEVSIKSGLYNTFIFSGGGNDILGGGALKRFLKNRSETDPNASIESWLNISEQRLAYEKLLDGYRIIANEVQEWSGGGTKFLIHGYDYPIPRIGGKWVGQPFESKGYDLVEDAVQIREILNYLIDSFYDVLLTVERDNSNTEVINLRNIVNGRWNDELHPKREASEDIAAIFMSHISPSA